MKKTNIRSNKSCVIPNKSLVSDCESEFYSTNKRGVIYQINTVKFKVIFFLCFILFGQTHSMAEPYQHIRLGIGGGEYGPLDKNELDRDEHDFNYGAMIDFEVGRKFKLKNFDDKFSFLIGTRVGYTLRDLKGIYTINKQDKDANIKVDIYSLFLTPGVSMKISNRLSIFAQANIGPSYIRWYEAGTHKDSFWVFYLPIDIGGEYKLKKDLFLTAGINTQLPIYTSIADTIFLGIRKEF